MHSRHTGSFTAQAEEEAYRNTHWIWRSLERLWAWLDHNRGEYSSSAQPAAWTSDTASSSTGCPDMKNPPADAPFHNTLENSFSEISTGNQYSPFSACDFPSMRDPFDPWRSF